MYKFLYKTENVSLCCQTANEMQLLHAQITGKSGANKKNPADMGHSCRHVPQMSFLYLSFFLYVMLLHSDSYLDLLLECSTLQKVPRPFCERAALSGFFQHRVLLNHRSHESRLTFRKARSVCHSTAADGNAMMSENGNQSVWSIECQKYWGRY